MSSRDAILQALRSAGAPEAELPGYEGLGTRFDDPVARFTASLGTIGGAWVRAGDMWGVDAEVRRIAVERACENVASLVPGIGAPNVDLGRIRDPHALANLDLAVVPGAFGVAENGAVWIPGGGLVHRALLFIAQHLALVVNAREIVHDMHEAYARLSPLPREYGVFLAGPSKTADIEQALVIGAHGARSCTVILVGPAA